MNSIHSRSWILKLTLMCAVLGVLLGLSLQTQFRLRSEGFRNARVPLLIEALKDEKKQNEDLKNNISHLQSKITDYEYQISRGGSSSKTLNDELQKTKLLTGLSPAEGPGVVVTLKDSSKKTPVDIPAEFAEELTKQAIIHDFDIAGLVNELKSAGAEAVAVNDQRVTAGTAVRCAGPVILVNEARLASPYVIKAIGDPKALEGALRMKNGFADGFSDSSMIDIRQEQKLELPAYTGSVEFKWVRPKG